MALQSLRHVNSRLASLCRPNVAVAAAKRQRRGPPDHDLVLYEYEASPWCRLIREYATIMDLKIHIRPCPRQTLFLEGAFDASSRFRPEAMEYLKKAHGTDDLTFPLLLDRTNSDGDPLVILQSYNILEHLWQRYGQDVLPSKDTPRQDQRCNSTSVPFPIRFLSLAAPSYLRPWPTCGLLTTRSIWDTNNNNRGEVVLYQAEGDAESRLVRESLCTLEIPYLSVAAGRNSSNALPRDNLAIPVLVDGDTILQGADACQQHLAKYKDPDGPLPKWWNMPPQKNIGRNGSFGVGVYAAFVRGSRAFVPDRVFE